MDKAHILNEIKRTAAANGGEPLGKARFFSETGIKETDWAGRFWARWGDALREAGFTANQLNQASDKAHLLEKLALLARESGKLPTHTEMKLKRRSDREFPSAGVYSRLGSKAELVVQLGEWCRGRDGFEDVVRWCDQAVPREQEEEQDSEPNEEDQFGFVYLVKSGKFYKIGQTNSIGRREYELRIQLPEPAATIHFIRTDDPIGIEVYWHNRFAAKRKNGEWFELDASDVATFKRRKFM